MIDVPAAAFRPPPKVASAVVALRPSASQVPDGFLDFVSLCFRHKRKKLRNNLDSVYPKERLHFAEADMRAEQLSQADLRRVYSSLTAAH